MNMSKKNLRDQQNIIWNEPNQGRLIIDDIDWQLVKADVDDAREGILTPSGKDRLIYYDLWDMEQDCLCEARVHFLYMRNA